MNPRLFPCLLLATMLAACIGTRTQSWQSEQFSAQQAGWRYYRWVDPPLPVDGDYQDHIQRIDQAVRAQIDAMLGMRGYQHQPQRAQFEVDYRIGDESVVGLPGPLSPTDEPERIFAGPNAEYEVSTRFYTHRTLAYHEVSHLKLSLFDVASKRIVWQRSASKLVDDPGASADKVSADIAAAAKKLFKGFPAASGP